jgi:hypothetical protein
MSIIYVPGAGASSREERLAAVPFGVDCGLDRWQRETRAVLG